MIEMLNGTHQSTQSKPLVRLDSNTPYAPAELAEGMLPARGDA